MSEPPTLQTHPAAPRPILRRATVRRSSSDYQAHQPPPGRRQSESALLATRRGEPTPHIEMPLRPPLRRQTQSNRSVAFSPSIEMDSIRSPRTPHTPTYPLIPASPRGEATLLGYRTRFRPLWLLGAANTSAAMFGMGAVIVQRAVWPVKFYDGLRPDGPTVLPGGTPGHGTAFGGITGGIIGGSIMTAIGVGGAVAASVLLVQDGRRLNRVQNPRNPNYRRTMAYFTAHQVGIAILVGHRFVSEAYRAALPPRYAWAIALPGGLGQAIFAVTQAQSFSSSEVCNGRMPLNRRGLISGGARGMVASFIVLGAIVGTPNASAYVREGVRLVAAVSTNLAYSLPLTTARLAGPAADVPVGAERYRGDWSAMQAFTLYVLARLLGTISSFWLSRSRWPAAPLQGPAPSLTVAGQPLEQTASLHTADAFRLAVRQAFRGLPPPLPSLPPDLDEVAGAAILMTVAFGASTYAFSQFHRDATPPYALARAYFAGATLSVLLGQTFRLLQEKAKAHADFELTWVAIVPGFLAQALAFICVPEMLSRSEVTRGNAPIPHRYQVIEAARGIGGITWYMWASMCGIIGLPPLVRQLTIWIATSATVLAMSLPDADTRRAQTGSVGTPQGEARNPFEI